MARKELFPDRSKAVKKSPGEGKYYSNDTKGKKDTMQKKGFQEIMRLMNNSEMAKNTGKTSPSKLAKEMEKSDAKRAALMAARAKRKK